MYMEQDPTARRNEGRCPGIWGARAPSRPADRAFPGEPLTSPGCWPSTSSTLQLSELPLRRHPSSSAWVLWRLFVERHAVCSIIGEGEGAPSPRAHMHLGSALSCSSHMPHMPPLRPCELGMAQRE